MQFYICCSTHVVYNCRVLDHTQSILKYKLKVTLSSLRLHFCANMLGSGG